MSKKILIEGPRYDFITQMSQALLLKSKSSSLPVDLQNIIEMYDNIYIACFSQLPNETARKLSLFKEPSNKREQIGSLLEIPIGIGSFDYIILYNDSDSEHIQRFTIAHELGHFILGHPEIIRNIYKETSRTTLTNQEYDFFEKEANYFARRLLVPLSTLPVISSFWGGINRDDISYLYNVSYYVASNVMSHSKNMLSNGFFVNNTKIKNKYYNSIKSITCIYTCHHCMSEHISETEILFCPICGSRVKYIEREDYYNYNSFERRYFNMKYKNGVELNDSGQAQTCPKCDNDDIDSEDLYCKICGVNIIQKCCGQVEYDINGNPYYSVEPCDIKLDGNARYCTQCGGKTTFFEQKLLRDWESEKYDFDETDTFFSDTTNNNDNDDVIPF